MRFCLLFSFLLCGMLMSCDNNKNNNPAAEGFNEAGSDPEAIALADSVMNALGGRKNYDNTNIIAWNFFGARDLVWDKKNNKARVSAVNDEYRTVIDLDDMSGKAYYQGEEVNHPDSLEKQLESAKNIWINDSYWLLMPFKLKDSGVTLKYLGEGTTEDGIDAEIISLTFDAVGVTPQNKYDVYIDKNDYLVKQWSYYADANASEPNFTIPWRNYKSYGDILLSGDRGERQLTDIMVFDNLPDSVFSSLSKIDYRAYQ